MTRAGSPIRPGDGAGAEARVVSAWEAHHAELFAFLARSTRDRALAEDLLRETYRRLTTEAGGDGAPHQVRGVLYRTAASLVVEPSRRQRRRVASPAPEARGLTPERTSDIERALDGLSVDARVALLLSGEGFTGDEIAAAIGRSAAATRTLLSLARTRVRVRHALFAAEGR